MNANSSRFGKFIELHYTENGRLLGGTDIDFNYFFFFEIPTWTIILVTILLSYFVVLAKIDDYILEKSRVVHRSSGEKNFHVFYALFAGMSRERLLYYFLEDPDCHR